MDVPYSWKVGMWDPRSRNYLAIELSKLDFEKGNYLIQKVENGINVIDANNLDNAINALLIYINMHLSDIMETTLDQVQTCSSKEEQLQMIWAMIDSVKPGIWIGSLKDIPELQLRNQDELKWRNFGIIPGGLPQGMPMSPLLSILCLTEYHSQQACVAYADDQVFFGNEYFKTKDFLKNKKPIEV